MCLILMMGNLLILYTKKVLAGHVRGVTNCEGYIKVEIGLCLTKVPKSSGHWFPYIKGDQWTGKSMFEFNPKSLTYFCQQLYQSPE